MRASEIERTWDALAAGRLSVQRCRCGTQRFSTGQFCRACGSSDWSWADLDGQGLVHSYTIVHRPRGRPTTLVLVDVSDVRILGVLRARRTPRIGAAVEVVPNARRKGPITFRLLD